MAVGEADHRRCEAGAVARLQVLAGARGGAQEGAADGHEGVDVLVEPVLAALALAILGVGHPQQEVVRHAAAH
eukprot:scaffold190160_cov26-Tisochrysis_lutea.AAC.4